jgi:nucleotide-binding universal stress UspA family protein
MKILLANDGGAPAVAARRLVEKIGDRARAEVTVMTVVPPPALPAAMFNSIMDLPSEEVRRRAGEIASSAADSLRNTGFRTEVVVGEGPAGTEILQLIERGHFDLAVLGVGNKTWLGHVLLGSVSSHVLHSSPSSTLVVHECTSSEERSRVLVGTDGSGESRLAIDVFCGFADPSRCDTLVASVVYPVDRLPYPYPISGGDREKEAEQYLTEQAEACASSGAERMRRAAFTARSGVLVGSPSSQLLKEADNIGADLMVVGSRGIGPFGRALMGSVSDHVCRHSRAALVGRNLFAEHMSSEAHRI